MSLSQLVYYSRKRDLGSGGIFGILDEARAGNEVAGITGVLLFNRSYFLQCLEGDREQVTRTFVRIAQDRRHSNVTLMSFQSVGRRDFDQWTMGLMDSTSPELSAAMRDILPVYELSPETMTGDAALAVLRRMRDLRRTVSH